jgi:TonB family protein
LEAPRGLWQAVTLALLGHGAVLAWLGALDPHAAPQGALHAAPLTFFMRPVLWSDPAQVPAEAAPPPAATLGASAETEVAHAAVAPPPQQQPQRQLAAEAGPEPPAAPAVDAPYLPRGELTVAPSPIGFVDVPFPEDVPGIVDLKVRVTLFIDEDGAVQRIRLDGPDVHPSFERAIRETFSAARFHPGERHQVAVRSQMRLEVHFQSPGGRRS